MALTKVETDNYQNELIAQILFIAVKQARNNSGFGVLNRISQNNILSHLWGPLFILKASHWPTFNIIPGYQTTISYMRNLKMDTIDLEIIENILLCRPDLIVEPGQISLAELMRNRAIEHLIVSNKTI